MTISFSGLASGLDTSSWVESLVRLKQAKVTTLEEKKENVLLSQETLNNIKSFFASFRSVIEKVTDAKFGVASMDLFAQNLATSSNLNVVTGSVTTEAEEATYNILVDQLASNTSAISNYKYTTTIVETSIAGLDSKLVNLGVNIAEGGSRIGVQYNGIEHGITLEQNDTIQTFIEKLQKIGVQANYNDKTGIFSMNINDGDINDIDNTGVVDALHLRGVNEGYTSNNLQLQQTDTVYSAATESTLMSELGVKTGLVTIRANDADYTVTINNSSTLGSFIQDLNKNHIDAELDSTGVFTLTGAEITNQGTTDILNALGLSVDIYSNTQKTGDLSVNTIVTQMTTATGSTLLKDIGEGIAVTNGQTVIVKNSNNEYKTITVGTTTSIGDLLSEINKAGLSATINSDGVVEISGGVITGGTFDAISALGLTTTPYSAMVTGKSLTHDVEEIKTVTSSTRLVEDLGISEGYLEITDASGGKHYEKIQSGKTMGQFISDLQGMGVNATLDETGVLTLVGGGLKTLSSSEVQALVNSGTITETNAAYKKGSDILTHLFGSSTPSSEQITTGSALSKTGALKYTVTETVNAESTTKLSELGITKSHTLTIDGTTFNINGNTTIAQLVANSGGKITFDEETSKLEFNGQITDPGGIDDIVTALSLVTTTEGKYAVSGSLYSKETVVATATTDTLLSEFGITNTLNAANRTVYLYDSDGRQLASKAFTESNKLGELVNWINTSGGSATLKDGVLKLTEGYIQNSTLEENMGLQYTSTSSYILGSVMTTTTTVGATGDSKLSDIVSNLGTTASVSGGYNLSFNGKALSVSANTTLNDLIALVNQNGGTAALDSTGRLNINGGTLTGSVAAALGFTSVTNVSSVSASGKLLQTTQEVYADGDTILKDIGISTGSIIINNKYGSAQKTINVDSTSSIAALLNTLKNEGINGTISNGVISLTSPDGSYITGSLATALGITSTSTTEVINTTQSSTLAVNYTDTITANTSSTLGEIGAVKNTSDTLVVNDHQGNALATITGLTTTSTVADMFNALKNHGIQASIADGVISLYSPDGKYISGNIATNLGITRKDSGSTTYTIGQSVSSTASVTYTLAFDVTDSTRISDVVTVPSSNAVIAVKDSTNASTKGTVTINQNTTFGEWFGALAIYGISASISNNKIKIVSADGNIMSDSTGTVLSQLGINLNDNSYTTIKGDNSQSSGVVTYSVATTEVASGSTKLSTLGMSSNSIVQIMQGSSCYATMTLNTNNTVDDFFNLLNTKSGGKLTGSISDGVIRINTASGSGMNITGDVVDNVLHIGKTGSLITVTTPKTATSSSAITYLTSGPASTSSKLGDIGISLVTDSNVSSVGNITNADKLNIGIYESNGSIVDKIAVSSTTTIGDLIDKLSVYGISASINAGVFLINSSSTGRVAAGNVLSQMGIGHTLVNSGTLTTTTGQTVTSSSAVTYQVSSDVDTSTKLADIVSLSATPQQNAVVMRNSAGTSTGSFTANSSTTVGDFINWINSASWISASLSNGRIVIENDNSSGNASYIEDQVSGGLLSKLGISANHGANNITTPKSATSSSPITYSTGGTTVWQTLTSSSAVSYTLTSTATTVGKTCTSSSAITYNVVSAGSIEDMTFAELGYTWSGERMAVIRNDNYGIYSVMAFTDDMTLGDFISFASGLVTIDGNKLVCDTSGSPFFFDPACELGLELGLTGTNGSEASIGTYVDLGMTYYEVRTKTVGSVYGVRGNVHIHRDCPAGDAYINESMTVEEALSQLTNLGYDYSWGTDEEKVYFYDYENPTIGYNYDGGDLGGLSSLLDEAGYKVTVTVYDKFADKTFSITPPSVTRTVTATTATTLKELGLGTTQYMSIVVCKDYSENVDIALTSSMTIQDMMDALYEVGITCNFTNGKLELLDNGSYIARANINGVVGPGISLFNSMFNIQLGEGNSYTVNPGSSTVRTIDISTTLKSLGLNGTYSIVVKDTAGNTGTVMADGSTVLNAIIMQLKSNYKMSASVSGGKITLGPSPEASGSSFHIESISPELADALKISGPYYSVEGSTTTADGNTMLGSLGLSSNASIAVHKSDGTTSTIAISVDDINNGVTINNLATLLNDVGISLTMSGGKVTLSSTGSNYITSISSNLASILNLSSSATSYYSTSSNPVHTNTSSNALGATITKSLSSATTLSDLGLSDSYYSTTVRYNGTTSTVRWNAGESLQTFLNKFTSYGISGTTSNGKVTFTPSSGYITGMESALASALKLTLGKNNSYTTSTSPITGYQNTNDPTYTMSDPTGSTATLSSSTTYTQLGLNDSYYNITVAVSNSEGSDDTFTAKWSRGESLQTLFDRLRNTYGIVGTVSNGKVTFTGANESNGLKSYILGIEAPLAAALKLQYGSGYTYTTSEEGSYSNTQSSKLTYGSSKTETLKSSTTLSQLGINSTQYVTLIDSAGTTTVLTVSSSDTISDLTSQLGSYGLTSYTSGGKFVVNPADRYFIKSMSSGLSDALKFSSGSNITYHTETVYDFSNSNSTTLEQTNSILQMTTSTTFGDLGLSGMGYITGVANGSEFSIAVSADRTLGDVIMSLSSKGISGEITDGKLTLTPGANCCITGISSSVIQSVLKLPDVGAGKSYTTNVVNSYTNTNSNSLKFVRNNLVISGDTSLSKINSYNNGDGKISIHKADGSFVTLTIASTSTLNDFFNQISAYGLRGSVSSDGKVSVTGSDNVYLSAVSGGSNILSALKIGSAQQNTQTIHSNRTSSILKETLTVAATGTSTLESLIDSSNGKLSFDASGKVSLALQTKSNAGDKLVTLSFSKTQTLTDVVDALQTYGISAKVDSTGKFSVSGKMTDFTISGTLGTYLMGSYTKDYQSDTTYNTSTVLTQKSVDAMSDSTALSTYGITNGNIVVMSDGKASATIGIDTTSTRTVGDFRNILTRYGFNASIDSSGRLSVTNLEGDYLASASGGSNILTKFGLEGASISGVTQQSSALSQTTVSNKTISMSSKLSDLTNSSGASLGITSGNIYVYKDGVKNTIYVDSNLTVDELAAKLGKFNVNVGITEGKLYFEGIGDSYITTDGLTSSSMTNLLSKIGVNSSSWRDTTRSESGELTVTRNVDRVINRDVKLSDLKDASGNSLGITTGTYSIYSNGVKHTETITAGMTVDDLLSTLEMHGINTSIGSNGAITLSANGNSYLEAGSSNLVTKLFNDWQFVNTYKTNKLETSETVTRAIDRDTKLSEINGSTYQDGYITVIKDGVQTNLSLGADETVGVLMDQLALYGFESVLNDSGQLIIKGEGNSTLKNYTGAGKASNALDILGVENSSWVVMNTYDGTSLDVVTKTPEIIGAGRDTLLSELGITTGEYYIYNNGVKNTALISSDETLGSFIDTLEKFGLQVNLTGDAGSAKLTVLGNGNSYVAKSASVTNSSNVVETLFGLGGPVSKYEYSALEETSSVVTTYTDATEETLLSYFDKPWGGTTLKAAGDLSVTVDGVTSVIEISPDETFGSLIDKFNALGVEATLSNGQLLIQSGYSTFTINSAGTTSSLLSTIGLVYQNDLGGYVASVDTVMATTTTVEERTLSVSNFADLSTKLGLLNISNGSLSVYRDGQKATIQIDSNETLGDLRSRLAAAFSDLDMKFEDGFMKIYSKVGKHVEIGSTTDTTNFSSITGITTNEDGEAVSARALYCVNGDSQITGNGLFRRGNVTEGTFYIGDAMFTVGKSTKLNDLISQINASDEANATAYWDTIDGKLVIKSRTTGAAYINIEAGTSNFTDIMGYTASEWAADGKLSVTRMDINSQELGNNAKFSINGTSYTSNSNTITSDISKIKGLTINLKGLTDGSAVTLTVERDKETLANAMSEVVDSYNELMKNVDEAIAIEGKLHGETTLKMIRNQLRNLMTSSDAGTTVFRNLDSIGICVDKASANNISTSNKSIINLAFDKDKFMDAYAADSDALKTLLIGSDTNKGVFTKVETLLESALQSVSGYFDVTSTSYTQKANKLDSKISRANKEVERYRARLEAKFQSMDMVIANMQQQYSSFLVT